MKPIIITATLSLVTGFVLGYIQKVRETDEYIHVVQVNGTLIEGKFQTIGREELNKLNDLIFDSYGQNHKILQILVKTEEQVVIYVGTRTKGEPGPYYPNEIPMVAEKKYGTWVITNIEPASVK